MNSIVYDLNSLNPREKRLAKEHLAIEELCNNNDFIEYKVTEREELLKGSPPKAYQIQYNVRSIVGVDLNKNPLLGDLHTVEIRLPKHYPVEPVACYAITDIWHPNIKWDGNYKGRICGNLKDFGKTYSLDLLILRIGQILQYKNYLADNVPPYPEEEKVAAWVRDYAEPLEIVDKINGINEDKIPTGPVEQEIVQESIEEKQAEEDSSLSTIPPPSVKKPGISIIRKTSLKQSTIKPEEIPPKKVNSFSRISIKKK